MKGKQEPVTPDIKSLHTSMKTSHLRKPDINIEDFDSVSISSKENSSVLSGTLDSEDFNIQKYGRKVDAHCDNGHQMNQVIKIPGEHHGAPHKELCVICKRICFDCNDELEHLNKHINYLHCYRCEVNYCKTCKPLVQKLEAVQKRMTQRFERKKTIIQKKIEIKSSPKVKESDDFIKTYSQSNSSQKKFNFVNNVFSESKRQKMHPTPQKQAEPDLQKLETPKRKTCDESKGSCPSPSSPNSRMAALMYLSPPREKTSFLIPESNDRSNESMILSDEDSEEFRQREKMKIIQQNMGDLYVTHKWYIIKESNIYYQQWKIFMILMNFYSSFIYAYYSTFMEHLSEVQNDKFAFYDAFFDSIFIFQMALGVFVEYHYPSSQEVERDLRKLLKIYITIGTFPYDIITVVPYNKMLKGIVSLKYYRLFYLIKIIRVINGFEQLNPSKLMKHIKVFFIKSKTNSKPQDEIQGEGQRSEISKIIKISYLIKTVRILIILGYTSLMFGLLWYIFCDFVLINQSQNVSEDETDPAIYENFLTHFDVLERPKTIDQMWALTYFAFTTLSTVGFGDYHPRNSKERLLGAALMLFGVMINSIVVESLEKMIKAVRQIDYEHEEYGELSKFINTIRRFNENIEIPAEKVKEYVSYFEYRWQHNRNLSVSTEDDFYNFDNLSEEMQMQIFIDYLFRDMIMTYSRIFLSENTVKSMIPGLRRQKTKQNINYEQPLTDMMDEYSDFIYNMVKALEPIYLESQMTLQKQGQKGDVIFFIMIGQIQIGYNYRKHLESKDCKLTIDLRPIEDKGKKFQFPVSVNAGMPVGLYEIVFDVPSHFMYKTTDLDEIHAAQHSAENEKSIATTDCFFIRRRTWVELVDESDGLPNGLKKAIFQAYMEKVYFPMINYQNKQVENVKNYEKEVILKSTIQFLQRRVQRNKFLGNIHEDKEFQKGKKEFSEMLNAMKGKFKDAFVKKNKGKDQNLDVGKIEFQMKSKKSTTQLLDSIKLIDEDKFKEIESVNQKKYVGKLAKELMFKNMGGSKKDIWKTVDPKNMGQDVIKQAQEVLNSSESEEDQIEQVEKINGKVTQYEKFVAQLQENFQISVDLLKKSSHRVDVLENRTKILRLKNEDQAMQIEAKDIEINELQKMLNFEKSFRLKKSSKKVDQSAECLLLGHQQELQEEQIDSSSPRKFSKPLFQTERASKKILSPTKIKEQLKQEQFFNTPHHQTDNHLQITPKQDYRDDKEFRKAALQQPLDLKAPIYKNYSYKELLNQQKVFQDEILFQTSTDKKRISMILEENDSQNATPTGDHPQGGNDCVLNDQINIVKSEEYAQMSSMDMKRSNDDASQKSISSNELNFIEKQQQVSPRVIQEKKTNLVNPCSSMENSIEDLSPRKSDLSESLESNQRLLEGDETNSPINYSSKKKKNTRQVSQRIDLTLKRKNK